jgi:hypothetical protein
VPSDRDEIGIKNGSYEYAAGNWKTGLVSGLGFEFGKGRQRLMTLSLQYARGLGGNDKQEINAIENNKPVTASFSSRSSSWGLSLGVPFTIGAKKPAVKRPEERSQKKSNCNTNYSKPACGRKI